MFILYWTENHRDRGRHIIGIFSTEDLLRVARAKAEKDSDFAHGHFTDFDLTPDKYYGRYT